MPRATHVGTSRDTRMRAVQQGLAGKPSRVYASEEHRAHVLYMEAYRIGVQARQLEQRMMLGLHQDKNFTTTEEYRQIRALMASLEKAEDDLYRRAY